MPARVDHVVNFDFPHSPVDYIHRAGRTARAGMRGRVTSLLQKRDLVLGERIQDALRNDRALDDLSPDRRQLPANMRWGKSDSLLSPVRFAVLLSPSEKLLRQGILLPSKLLCLKCRK